MEAGKEGASAGARSYSPSDADPRNIDNIARFKPFSTTSGCVTVKESLHFSHQYFQYLQYQK
jgi:hypothetical protein